LTATERARFWSGILGKSIGSSIGCFGVYWLAFGGLPWNYIASSIALIAVPILMYHYSGELSFSVLVYAFMMVAHQGIFSVPMFPAIPDGASLLQIFALLSFVTRPFIVVPLIFNLWAFYKTR